MCVRRPSFTGKMNASDPGVCPGISTIVTVSSPSFTGSPSLRTRSRFGFTWFAAFDGGFAGYIRSQSAAVNPTFAP